MTADPLVSVVILHYQRPEALAQTLASVQRQSYARREIIVVANGSGGDIRELIESETPEATLVVLDTNRGACAGRNAGIRSARGEVIITLDNDIAFEDIGALARIVEALTKSPEVHVLAFKVCDGQTGALLIRAWCHPRHWKEFKDTEFETDHFNEGACAVRREVYERAGLYYEPLFFGAEGWDLVLRFIECGFRIHYLPGIRVRHLTENKDRPGERPYYYYTRAYIWTAVKDYPMARGAAFVAMKLSMMLLLAARSGNLRAFARGVKDGLRGIPKVALDRMPVQRNTLRYIRQLERTRPSLRLRFERHREATQL